MKIFFAFAMLVMGCSNETRGKEVVQALFKLPPGATQEERVKVCKDLVENASESQAKQYAVEIALSYGASEMSNDEKQILKGSIETFIAVGYTECVSLVKK